MHASSGGTKGVGAGNTQCCHSYFLNIWQKTMTMKKMKATYEVVGLVLILELLSQIPESTHFQTISSSSFKRVLHFFEISAPFNMLIFFSDVRAFHWGRTCLLLCSMSNIDRIAHAMPFSQYVLLYSYEEHIVYLNV